MLYGLDPEGNPLPFETHPRQARFCHIKLLLDPPFPPAHTRPLGKARPLPLYLHPRPFCYRVVVPFSPDLLSLLLSLLPLDQTLDEHVAFCVFLEFRQYP